MNGFSPSIHAISVVIDTDEIVVITIYRPVTKVGMVLTEEALVKAAAIASLNHDAHLEIYRSDVDHE